MAKATKATKNDESFAYQVGKDIAQLEKAVDELKKGGGLLVQRVVFDTENIPAQLRNNTDLSRQLTTNITVKVNPALVGKIDIKSGKILGEDVIVDFTYNKEHIFVAADLKFNDSVMAAEATLSQVKKTYADGYVDRKLKAFAEDLWNKIGEINYNAQSNTWDQVWLDWLNDPTAENDAKMWANIIKSENPDWYERHIATFPAYKAGVIKLHDDYQAGLIPFDQLV